MTDSAAPGGEETGLVRPDDAKSAAHAQREQAEQRLRADLEHLIEEASVRLQAARTISVSRPERPEGRWPVTLTVLAATVLQVMLPQKLRVLPGDLRFLLPALEIALLVGLILANPVRFVRHSRLIRQGSIALVVLISGANAVSAGLLVSAIITGNKQFAVATSLLIAGGSVWVTNVIAFALWYWEFDRGGPVHRGEGRSQIPDFLFPQMTAVELARPGWDARFLDYLYVSFTNATAFSPTDVMPLARWAKMTMMVQSAVSLAVGALVIARAVNIL